MFHFTDGICAFLDDDHLTVYGGQCRVALSDHKQLHLTALRAVESLTLQQLIAVADIGTAVVPAPPWRLILSFGEGFITTDELAEDLLWNSQRIGYCCRWVTAGSNAGPDYIFRNMCETLIAGVQDGHLGPTDLIDFIQSSEAGGRPVRACFFLHNVISVFEDMRSALLRAEYHLLAMTRYLWQINETQSPAQFAKAMKKEPSAQMEVKHASETGDRVADNFTSAVIACHSALDLLLRLFVFLCRDPVVDPTFPRDLHFSDIDSGKLWRQLTQHKPGDCPAAEAPNAIPHLPRGKFARLRKLRNSLVHNMAEDDTRPEIYVGIGLLRVGHQPIQYAEYRTRDVAPDGSFIEHPWFGRFYQQDRDAQAEMAAFLRETWDTVYDTAIWLERRLRRDHLERTGVIIPT